MKISYKNTKQDLIDYSIHSYYNSEKSSGNSEKSFKNKCLSILVKFLILSLILQGLSISYDKSNKFLIYFSLLMLVIYIIYILSIIINPNIFKDIMLKIIGKKTTKNIKEESLSDTTLIVSEEGISVENDAILYKTMWANIEKAMVTENHVFIYIKYNGDSPLFIIPLRAFNEPSEKESFLEIIRQHDVNIVNSIDPKGRKN
ncbi:YcxB family protein [Clostridium amazonitimonense]|uniref:YcxB family protein n=1 Tax=Clostridium amazonitimonense TaxID=1499689 RepID=UPI00050984E0|nr:YcxB family protein [Clostridium amazonitimonense]